MANFVAPNNWTATGCTGLEVWLGVSPGDPGRPRVPERTSASACSRGLLGPPDGHGMRWIWMNHPMGIHEWDSISFHSYPISFHSYLLGISAKMNILIAAYGSTSTMIQWSNSWPFESSHTTESTECWAAPWTTAGLSVMLGTLSVIDQVPMRQKTNWGICTGSWRYIWRRYIEAVSLGTIKTLRSRFSRYWFQSHLKSLVEYPVSGVRGFPHRLVRYTLATRPWLGETREWFEIKARVGAQIALSFFGLQ